MELVIVAALTGYFGIPFAAKLLGLGEVKIPRWLLAILCAGSYVLGAMRGPQ